MQLATPKPEHLASYLAALTSGRSTDNERGHNDRVVVVACLPQMLGEMRRLSLTIKLRPRLHFTLTILL